MMNKVSLYLFKFAGSVGARQVGLKVSAQTNYAPTCLALTFGEDTDFSHASYQEIIYD